MFNKIKKEILIDGMSCDYCAKRIEKGLYSIDSIFSVKVNLKKNSAIIKLNKEIDENKIIAVIEKLDYRVVKIK